MCRSIFMILIISSSLAFANTDLKFNSAGLNSIVDVFKTYSPELVKTGQAESGSCGTYNSVFVIKKVTATEIASEFILNVGPAHEIKNLDLTALEISEDQISELSQKIVGLVSVKFQSELKHTQGKVFDKDTSGVIYSYQNAYTSIIKDLNTNEFLLLSGDTQQDDCD